MDRDWASDWAEGLDAVFAVRGPSELAADLNISKQAVSAWQRVPAERVIEVERLTGVPREKQRPDIYPPPDANRSKRTG